MFRRISIDIMPWSKVWFQVERKETKVDASHTKFINFSTLIGRNLTETEAPWRRFIGQAHTNGCMEIMFIHNHDNWILLKSMKLYPLARHPTHDRFICRSIAKDFEGLVTRHSNIRPGYLDWIWWTLSTALLSAKYQKCYLRVRILCLAIALHCRRASLDIILWEPVLFQHKHPEVAKSDNN